jgi:hypothetical protein
MRRINWKTVSTLVTTIVIAGCMDNGVSAPQIAPEGAAPVMMAPEGRPSLSLHGKSSDNTSADFVVTPNGGTFFIGNNAVYFPAQSICDPEKSSYGPETWDRPCVAAKGAVKIHAEVRTAKLGTWIDFSPSMRFVPSANPSQWVWIYMYTPAALGATDLSKFGILYTKSLGAPGVSEYSSDASLRTYVDSKGGLLSRRIKHFSGFATSSGKSCDPDMESDCYPTPTGP